LHLYLTGQQYCFNVTSDDAASFKADLLVDPDFYRPRVITEIEENQQVL